MADANYVASAATDVQAFTGPGTVYGATLSAAAATVVYLRDGTSVAGPIVGILRLGGAGSVTAVLPALQIVTGLFIDRDGVNAAELVIYTS